MKTKFYYVLALFCAALTLANLSCVSETTDTEGEIDSIAEIKQAAYRGAVWEYKGKSTVVPKVIEALKSNPENKKQLEHDLLRREVLWEEALFLKIENKKRILVPFLGRGGENVVGALSLSRNAEGKVEWDIVTRWDLVKRDAWLPHWDKSLWNGYFRAWDKDILNKDNGSPGLLLKEEENQETQLKSGKNSGIKTSMGMDCFDVVVGRSCVQTGTCVSWGSEGMLDCVQWDFGDPTCTPMYNEVCFWFDDYDPWDDTGNDNDCYDASNPNCLNYDPCYADPCNCDPNCGYDYDESIINNLSNPCARNIFNELENGIFTNNPLKPEVEIPYEGIDLNFSEIILKLFYDSNGTHLTIQNGDAGNANANTVRTVITVSNTYLASATQLSIARTMIHESVHAYINAYFYGYSGFENKTMRDKLHEFAKNKGFTSLNAFHHEFMGQYVDAIAYSLYEWDKQYGTGGDLGWDYYRSMGFGGLFQVDSNGSIAMETDVFKALVPNSSDRQDIADILVNEQENNNDAEGTKCD